MHLVVEGASGYVQLGAVPCGLLELYAANYPCVLACPKAGHLCRRVGAEATLAQAAAGLDSVLAQATRQAGSICSQGTPSRVHHPMPPAHTHPDAMDTAGRLLTPLVWGDTKTTLGILSDSLSPGDRALALSKLLNIAWAS
jgi:hypothetical protein